MKIDQIAINSVCTAQAPPAELLAAYAEAGFRKVEFALKPVKAWLAEGPTVADLKTILEGNGLQCVGGFEAPVLCFADRADQRANHDLHAANAELLAGLGGGVLVVGTDGPQENSLHALKAIARTCRALAERLPPTVSLAVEFNWSPVVRSLRSAAIVAEAADHPRVGILFDPAHYHCTPSKLDDITRAVAGRILHVHVDDMADRPGDLCDCNWDRVLPGEGIINLAELLGRIERMGYQGTFSIEVFNRELRELPPGQAARRCHEAMLALCE